MKNFFQNKENKSNFNFNAKKSFQGCKYVGKSNNIMIKNENNEDKQNKKIN
jgi:hypothetical protein